LTLNPLSLPSLPPPHSPIHRVRQWVAGSCLSHSPLYIYMNICKII
jgi:hypothetical protein